MIEPLENTLFQPVQQSAKKTAYNGCWHRYYNLYHDRSNHRV